MTWLLDTNVISKTRKGPRCAPNVASRYDGVEAADPYLSVTVLDELRKGIERLRPREPLRAETLSRWLDDVTECWAMMAATRPVPATDGFPAATAKVHGLVLVTRNTRGVAGLGAEVLDPFAAAEARGSGV